MALKKLKQEGYQILFVPMHGPFDQNASRDVVDLMGEETYMLPYKMDIDEKISILSECSLLIGMRLHALIFFGCRENTDGWNFIRSKNRFIFKTSESTGYRKCGWRLECRRSI